LTSQDRLPKVLVVSPTYEGKDYIFDQNFKAITSFDYPNYDYLYIDNSPGTSYLKTLRNRGAKAVRVQRGGNSRQALCNAQNYARLKVIQDKYDYLMFVESDLVPPKETIRRLLNYNLPVIGATYFIGQKHKFPCLFVLDFKQPSGQMGTRLIGAVHDSSGNIRGINQKEMEAFIGKGVKQIHGMGLGCTLIRADVIKRFPFWYDSRFSNKHSDVYFYMDLHNNRIPVFADTSFIIPHFPSDWKNVKDM
jgi:hypothetical protein